MIIQYRKIKMRAHLNSYFNRGFIDHPSYDMLFRHLFHVGVGKWVPILSKIYGTDFNYHVTMEHIMQATFEGASYIDFENRWEEILINDEDPVNKEWKERTGQTKLEHFDGWVIKEIAKSSYYLGLLNEFDPDGENRKYLLNYYKDEWRRRHTLKMKKQ